MPGDRRSWIACCAATAPSAAVGAGKSPAARPGGAPAGPLYVVRRSILSRANVGTEPVVSDKDTSMYDDKSILGGGLEFVNKSKSDGRCGAPPNTLTTCAVRRTAHVINELGGAQQHDNFVPILAHAATLLITSFPFDGLDQPGQSSGLIKPGELPKVVDGVNTEFRQDLLVIDELVEQNSVWLKGLVSTSLMWYGDVSGVLPFFGDHGILRTAQTKIRYINGNLLLTKRGLQWLADK